MPRQSQSQSQSLSPGSQSQSSGSMSQSSASKDSRSLFSGYTPLMGVYDEMVDSSGLPRPAWKGIRTQLDRVGQAELSRRWAQSQRLIDENAIVYSAYGEEDRPRPWTLDPAPLLLPEAEWQATAEGLQQRATLLEEVLKDLYGDQKLIASGLLPPELLYEHPGYRLPLHRAPEEVSSGRPFMRFYAADLGRAPDGAWWVLADRTEAPSGAGFVLENRVVTSRLLAEPFRDRRVRRLAPFYLSIQESLRSASANGRRNPSVALLSQGPKHPNYFEDAYLARYLGYTLVEGGDLTVRNRRLWMKTLDGLTPIDVLVRRPNSDLCDPLELGGVSPAGVAGLLQAERDGSLLVANRCGSGLVESPVFMAFMPRLCQAVLGEPLKLPGVATWWCGEPESLEFVLQNLDRLVLKRAYRQRGEESLLMQQLRETPREELIKLIRSDPRAYVGQELVERSATPAWRDGRLAPERVAIRAFAVAQDGSYEVMSGGLARTTRDLVPLESSARSGEGSKDVWIVGEEPVEPISLLPSEQEAPELVRIGAELPSRVADHSFWLGRYIERADTAARLVRLVTTRLTSEGDILQLTELPALVRALAEQGQIEPGYAVDALRDLLPKVESALPNQVLNRDSQSGSLAATVGRLFDSAAQVRDRLSRDAWRIVLRISQRLRRPAGEASDLTDLLNLTDELVIDLASLGGMVIESMTRTQFYRFLDIGRRIERTWQSTDLLTATLIESGPAKPALLEALLESADSLMTYRSRYRASVKLAPVLDLLITDETNPRSLAYQINTLQRHVGKLPRTGEGAAEPAEARAALSLAHRIRMIDILELSEEYELGRVEPLATLLEAIGADLPALSNAITLKYLSHAGPPRQLSPS